MLSTFKPLCLCHLKCWECTFTFYLGNFNLTIGLKSSDGSTFTQALYLSTLLRFLCCT